VPFPAAFVPPRVHDEEYENHKTQNQQNDGSRLGFPKLLEASRDIV